MSKSVNISQKLVKFDPAKTNRDLNEKSPEYWEAKGEKNALKLFHDTVKQVPAYKKFLQNKKVSISGIKTIEDFKKLPDIDKKNYQTKYPLEDLCRHGKLEDNQIISVSSGSTGDPFLWPRGIEQEVETTITHELFLRNFFKIDKHSTLLVNAYSMGMYVAGVFTLNCSLRIGQKGYPLTIVNPGIEKEEAIKLIKHLSGKYEQVILAGYPPFIKDIIDLGEMQGINWKKMTVKFIFGGEGFSEEWREHILDRVKVKNYYTDSMNTFGSADAAILAHETPLSVLIRKLVTKDKKLRHQIFGDDDRVPGLFQYFPHLRYFEEVNDELLFSAPAGIPLVRYNIHDHGRVTGFEKMMNICKEFGYDIPAEAKRNKIDRLLWKLPFVNLYGRSDFTATIYGLNIYPENIKAALENKEVKDLTTGKFTMFTKFSDDQDQYLLINLELKKGKRIIDKKKQKIKKEIVSTLRKNNSEYNKLYKSIGKKANPQVDFYDFGDEKYFSGKIKHKWVRNNYE